MSVAVFVAVDWGTSHMRAYLCRYHDSSMKVLACASGAGIAKLQASAAEEIFSRIAPWVNQYGKMPLLMSGMVGSNIGWVTVPYRECPVSAEELLGHRETFVANGHQVSIVPGIKCTNPQGVSDVMRGEELQILGWMQLDPACRTGEHTLCLPGTHTKWALLRDGHIVTFMTALTGELFSLLQTHSILLPNADLQAVRENISLSQFLKGVEISQSPDGSLLHALFGVRSRQINDELSQSEASSYLSGLIIGADIRGATQFFLDAGKKVSLIGSPALCRHFSDALQVMGSDSEIFDAADVTLQGYNALYEKNYL